MKEKIENSAKYKTALIKKALGYDATEVVEEYVSDDSGEIKLSKKKVTKKNVPPDLTALKMLLDQTEISVSEMSDEQLEEEKQRLLKLLNDFNEKEKKIAKKKTKKG
jgi:hypothetical protein